MSSSVYLVEKCESLENVLKFMKSNELRFLAQIDFWDWEMENLMFSFSNFEERSEAWGDRGAVKKKLSALGIDVKGGGKWELQYQTFDQKHRVEAPRKKLLEVIGLWNGLIRHCEKHFLGDQLKPALREQFGYVSSLEKYIKEMK